MIDGNRLSELMRQRDVSQAALGRRIGVTQSAIWKLLNGGQGSTHLHKIARELGTSPAYLTGEIDNPEAGAASALSPEEMARELNVAVVPELALGYSMGGGSVFDAYEQTGVATFPRDFLRTRMNGSVEDLFVARGEGDSMEPTLRDADMILVDTAQADIRQQDRIWAISYGDLGMIKRVRRLPAGEDGAAGYDILSDNREAVAPFRVYDGEMHVVGRVIWIGRWV